MIPRRGPGSTTCLRRSLLQQLIRPSLGRHIIPVLALLLLTAAEAGPWIEEAGGSRQRQAAAATAFPSHRTAGKTAFVLPAPTSTNPFLVRLRSSKSEQHRGLFRQGTGVGGVDICTADTGKGHMRPCIMRCQIKGRVGNDNNDDSNDSNNQTVLLAPPRRPGFPQPSTPPPSPPKLKDVPAQQDVPPPTTEVAKGEDTSASVGRMKARGDSESSKQGGKIKHPKRSSRMRNDRAVAGEAAGSDSLPKNLMKYTASRKLMNAVEPFAVRFSTPVPDDISVTHARAVGAVNGLYHLKRCERDVGKGAERQRFDSFLRIFADVCEQGMSGLTAKHLSLLINAMAGRWGYSSLMSAATDRVLSVCMASLEEAEAHGGGSETTTAGAGGGRVGGGQTTLDGRAAAMILNSLSKAGSFDTRVLDAMSKVVIRLGVGHPSLGGQNVGLILNSFAKARRRDTKLLDFLSLQARALPPSDIDAQALSNILNAFANLNVKDDALLESMSGVAQSINASSFSSQAISNIVNAYARASIRDDALLSCLSKAAHTIPSGKFSSQAVATCINGWSKLGACDAPLFRYLSAGAQMLPPHTFSPQSISSILNGLSRCDIKDQRLVSFLDQAVREMPRLDVNAVSAIAGAFSRIGEGSDSLFDHLEAQFLAASPPNEVEVAGRRPSGANAGRGGAGAGAGARGGSAMSFGADVAAVLLSFDRRSALVDGPLLQHAWHLLRGMQPHELEARELASLIHVISKIEPSGAASGPGSGDSSALDSFSHLLLSSLRRGITLVSRGAHATLAQTLTTSANDGGKDTEKHQFSPQMLSMTAAACARLGARYECRDVIADLCCVAGTLQPEEFDIVGVVSLLSAAPRLTSIDDSDGAIDRDKGVDALLAIARERILSSGDDEMSDTMTVTLLGALGNAGVLPSDDAVRSFMEGHVRRFLDDRVAVHARLGDGPFSDLTSQLAASMANAGIEDDELWDMLTSAVLSVGRGGWGAQSLATTLNAYARAVKVRESVFAHLGKVLLLEVVGKGEPAASVKGGRYELWELSPSAIGSVLNSYTKVELFDEDIFRRLSTLALLHEARLFDAISISNIANAFARSRLLDTRLFEHLGDAVEGLDSPDAQTLSIIANAFARASERNSHLSTGVFEHIARHTMSVKDGGWTAQAAANLLNAFSRVERRNEETVRHLCRALCSIPADKLDPQSIAITFHSVAVLHIVDLALFRHISLALEWMPPASCGPQVAANVAWSAAVMRPFFFLAGNSPAEKSSDRRLLSWVWDAVSAHLSVMDNNCKSQVHQLVMSYKIEDSPLPPCMTQEAVDECRRAFESNSNVISTTSTLQHDVANCMKSLGYHVEEEVIEEHTGYSLDIMVRDDRMVVEVDGPTHFCHGSRQPLGRTVLKHRHLRGMGYTLVTVPFWDWKVKGDDELSSGGAQGVVGDEAKRTYLENQIRVALECKEAVGQGYEHQD